MICITFAGFLYYNDIIITRDMCFRDVTYVHHFDLIAEKIETHFIVLAFFQHYVWLRKNVAVYF